MQLGLLVKSREMTGIGAKHCNCAGGPRRQKSKYIDLVATPSPHPTGSPFSFVMLYTTNPSPTPALIENKISF
jgi:hypothetical protein